MTKILPEDRDTLYEGLPKELVKAVKSLSEPTEEKKKAIIKTIKTLSPLERRFILEAISVDESIAITTTTDILRAFLQDTQAIIREQIVFQLAMFKAKHYAKELETLVRDENERVQAKTLWALAKFGWNAEQLSEQVINELLRAEEDQTRIFLAATLYLLNNNPNSREMQTLKEYFLTNYYDLEKDEFSINLMSTYGQSAQLIGNILWEAGIEIAAIDSLEILELKWLIEKA